MVDSEYPLTGCAGTVNPPSPAALSIRDSTKWGLRLQPSLVQPSRSERVRTSWSEASTQCCHVQLVCCSSAVGPVA